MRGLKETFFKPNRRLVIGNPKTQFKRLHWNLIAFNPNYSSVNRTFPKLFIQKFFLRQVFILIHSRLIRCKNNELIQIYNLWLSGGLPSRFRARLVKVWFERSLRLKWSGRYRWKFGWYLVPIGTHIFFLFGTRFGTNFWNFLGTRYPAVPNFWNFLVTRVPHLFKCTIMG